LSARPVGVSMTAARCSARAPTISIPHRSALRKHDEYGTDPNSGALHAGTQADQDQGCLQGSPEGDHGASRCPFGIARGGQAGSPVDSRRGVRGGASPDRSSRPHRGDSVPHGPAGADPARSGAVPRQPRAGFEGAQPETSPLGRDDPAAAQGASGSRRKSSSGPTVRTMSSMLDDMSPSWSRCSARLEPPSGRSSSGSARLAEWLPSRRRTVIEAV
jgi:hypothetical protein